MLQIKPNPIRQEEDNKPEEKKKVTTWQEVSATLPSSKKKSNRVAFEVDPVGHMIQASGIELLQSDVFALLGDSEGYFSSYKAGSPDAGLLGRITSMRGAIAEEKKYFQRNARFFSQEQLASYNAAMDAWDASLQTYERNLQTAAQKHAETNKNPLTGKPLPTQLSAPVDFDRNNTADAMYPGGELQLDRDRRRSMREAPLIEKKFEEAARYEKYNQNFQDGNFNLTSIYEKASSAQTELAPMEEQLKKLNSQFQGRDDLREEWRTKILQEAQPYREAVEEYLFYDAKIREGVKNDKETVEKGKQLHKEAWKNYEAYLDGRRDYKTAIALSDEGSNDAVNSIRRQARWQYPLAIDVSSLNSEDQTMFYYLVGIGQEKYAIAYANDASVRKREAFSESIKEWAGTNFGTGLLATIGSVALLPYAWSDPILSENANALTGLSGAGVGFGSIKDNLRAGVSESINQSVGTLPEELPIIGGAGLGDLYQLGMSGVDSYVSGLLFGSTGASAILGTSAMSSAYNSAIERGADKFEALMNGFAQGAAETLFEKISLGKLFDGKVSGSAIKQLLIQGGIEASEEALTSIANHFSDIAIMGDKSEYNMAVENYLRDGKTQEEAQSLATKDFYEGIVRDALGGFLIGSTMQGIQEASTWHEANTLANGFAEVIVSDRSSPEYEKYAALAGITAEDSKESAKEKFKKWAFARYRSAISIDDLPTPAAQNMAAVDSQGESTAVDDNPQTHTAQEMQTIEEYKNSVDSNLVQFVEESQNGGSANDKYILNAPTQRAVADIKNITGIDTTDFKTAIERRQVWHIIKRHGENGLADSSMSNVNDIARIQYVLENYDGIKYGGTSSAYTTNKENGMPAQASVVVFSKKVDGTYYVAEAVPDTKRKTLFVTSAYIDSSEQKETGNSQLVNAQKSPVETPEASSVSIPVNDNIAQFGESVNTEQSLAAEPSEITGGMEDAEVFDDGGQRDEGLGSRGQGRTVEEGTGGSVAAGQTRSEKDVIADVRKNATAQSARSIGLENGSEEASVYVLSDADIESVPQWQGIKRDAEADGARVVLFAGDLKVHNRTTGKYANVEGVHQTDGNGNTTYYIKADKKMRSAQKIYLHEKFHNIVSNNPQILGDLVRSLEAKYGKQEIAALVNSYVEAYDGIYGRFEDGMTEEETNKLVMQYMNEVFADVYAGIHRGRANTARAKEIMDSQTTEVQRAAQNLRAMRGKNAPPEQMYSLEGYSEHELENWKNSKRIIVFQNEMQLRKFVSDASKGINSNKKIYFGKVSRELAQRIYAETGIDVEGFNCSLSGYEVQKILKDHGNEEKEALRGQRAITEDDFVSIPEVIQSPDAVILSPKLYNGKPVIEFEKYANGKVNVTAYVSDKHIDLIVQTMYASKKSGSLAMPTDERTSVNTPEANDGTTSTKDNLTDGRKNVKQDFSVEDDVAELDEAYAQKMAEDDTPEGLALDDDKIDDYHALAKEEKLRRAKNATTNTLRNRIKSSEKAIAAHREAKNALKNIGGLTKQAAEQIDQKIKLIRETMQIDREALKEKQAAEEKHKKKEREEKAQIEIREQKAKTAQKELRQNLLNLFSVKLGVRFKIAQEIDKYSDELIKSGRLTNESRRELFNLLYEHGEEFAQADEYYGDIRRQVQQGRIYVSESVRSEFGDDWDSFRKRAWANRIYLTDNQNDIGIDVWTDDLAEIFGGTFDASADLKTQLETIVALAEEGKDERVTIAEMMQRNRDNYGWSIEEQMDELEQKVDRMLETFAQKADLEIRLRQESVRKLMNDRAYFQKRMENNRNARMENVARNQVMRGIEKLSKMRRKASPEYRKQIDEVLKDIDTVARSISARGLEDLQELERLYSEQKEAQGANFLSSPYVEARLSRLNKTQLDNMDIEKVRELGRVVSGIVNAIQNSNKMLSDTHKEMIHTVAEKVNREIASSKGSKDGAIRKYLLNHMDAKRVFGQLSGWVGGTFEAMGENLSKGQERMMHYQLNAMRIFDDFLAKKENQKWIRRTSGEDAKWIKIEVPDGFKITPGEVAVTTSAIEITPMMRVSLLMHSMNEDNLRHIKGGGITIPDKHLYKKGKLKEAYAKGTTVKMEPATVKAIVQECTEKEKEFAKLLEQYFNGLSKDSINEVSMLLDGFERAGGEHYFHIKTDPSFLENQNDAIKRDLSVQALGSVVNERLHASNPIVLEDATSALMEHVDNISKYYGFAVPLRDLNAVLSYTFHQENNAFSGSVMKTLKKMWGSSAEEYINKLTADLQMPENSGDLISNFAARLRGNYAQAVIMANLSSLLKQTTSYPVALPYLKTGGLIHGLKKLGKSDLKNLEKYSAVYWYRNLGNSTMELSDALSRKGFADKLPLLFNATQKMDSFTTRRILAGCEYRVMEDMKLKPGTQEEIDSGTDRYWTEVAKLFNEVVLKTQSNSTIMEKPQITRAEAGNISRFFTMFRTDSFQQYNMTVEALGRLNAARKEYKTDASAENKKALREAKKFAARTMTGILTGQMGCTLVAMLLKIARFDDDEFRDEDGNLDFGKIALYFGSGIIEGYSGFLVGAEILYSAAEMLINKFVDGDARWWDLEPTGLSAFNDAIESGLNLIETLADANLTDGKAAIRETAIALSKIVGFPLENLEKYSLMTARWFAPEWVEKYQNYWEEITKENLSKESMRTIGDAIGVLMDNRTDGLSREHKEEIARLYVAGGVGAVPTGIPSYVSYTNEDGEEVKVNLDGKQREKYREVWRETIAGSLAELLSTDEYEQANDERKAELIDKLYKYANQIAQNAVLPEKEIQKWVQQGQNAVADGIALEEYICFRVALGDIDGKNDSGESVDGLKAQRCMEYLETMGWSDEQEKNIYLDVLASESKKKDTQALMDAGLTWEQTNDIVSILGNKKWEHMNAIIKSNASEKVKAKALEVYASDKEKKLIRTGYKYGVLLKWYAEVRNNADTDGSGHVSLEEATEYIYGMGLTWQEMAYLWQMVTDGKEGKSNPFSQSFGEEFWQVAHEDDPPEEEEKPEDGGGFFDFNGGGIFG